MSYPILPMGATSAPYVKKHYPALLKNVVHDCTTTIDGIYLFNDLVSAKGNIANETPGFKEYDAHGGDMACHIRAGMLQELYEYHCERTQVTGQSFLDGDVVRQYVDQLHIVRKNAQDACLQLTKHNVNPEKIGIPLKRDTASHIMEVLGWNTESVGSPDIYSPCANPRTPGSRTPSTSSLASGASSDTPSGSQTPANASESGSLSSFSAMSISSSISSTSGVSDVDSLTFPKWNVEDSRMAVLFLAATSALSNFKEFARMGSRITVRFIPKKALDAGNEVIEPYWDRSNTNYADFGINRIKDRNGFLQKWISRLSCSWIQTWATNLGLSQDLQRLVLDSTHRSPREVSVIGAFPAFLVCREIWASRGWPILIIDRHFCGKGYHPRAYTTKPVRDHVNSVSELPGLLQSASWPLYPVSFDDLLSQEIYKTKPYITIFGNSMLGGSHPQYLSTAFREDGHHQIVPCHNDETCEEQCKHDEAFLATDHDLLAKCLLADHCQYPFEVLHQEVETCGEPVSRLKQSMESIRGLHALKVNDLGGGPVKIDIHCWEHVFSETPARVAAEVRSKVQEDDLNWFF